jgi:hypothetical protein
MKIVYNITMDNLEDLLTPDEKALHDALVEIAQKYGKFNEDGSGIWAGYESAEENEDKEIGVKCSNCALYAGGVQCEILAFEVEAEGKCRFAVIPDGYVNMSGEMDDDMSKADLNLKPTDGMKSAARRALEWKKEGKRGGTRVGLARANQIVNGVELSESTVARMYSFFSRHEVDKKATGFSSGEEGFPSPGRVAWDLWGGDAGFTWSTAKWNSIKNQRENKSDIIENTEADAIVKRDYSPKQRRAMAARGQALPDGSYPIADRADLENAIQAVGRASSYEAAKRHIIRRARALGLTEMLPEDWKKSMSKSMNYSDSRFMKYM